MFRVVSHRHSLNNFIDFLEYWCEYEDEALSTLLTFLNHINEPEFNEHILDIIEDIINFNIEIDEIKEDDQPQFQADWFEIKEGEYYNELRKLDKLANTDDRLLFADSHEFAIKFMDYCSDDLDIDEIWFNKILSLDINDRKVDIYFEGDRGANS